MIDLKNQTVESILAIIKERFTIGSFCLSEIFGHVPFKDKLYLDTLKALREAKYEFLEDRVGIDIFKSTCAPTLIDIGVIAAKQSSSQPVVFTAGRASVFTADEKALIENIKNQVKKALEEKRMYQLSALTGDLSVDASNNLTSKISEQILRDLEKENYRLSFTTLSSGKRSYEIHRPVPAVNTEIQLDLVTECAKLESSALIVNVQEIEVAQPIQAAMEVKAIQIDTVEELAVVEKSAEQIEIPVEASAAKKTKTVKAIEKIKNFVETSQESAIDSKRLQVVEEIQEINKYLDTIDGLLQGEWPTNAPLMQAYVGKIATVYAHLHSIKVDAEASYKRRAGSFFHSGAAADLKQYQYKDVLATHCLEEETLKERIDGQLKIISKHSEILLTLISYAKEEMRLNLKTANSIT